MPPSAEQERIVAEIDKQFTRLEAAVAALNRAKANLKPYRATVLKAACDGASSPPRPNSLARRAATTRPGSRSSPASSKSGAPSGRLTNSPECTPPENCRRMTTGRRSTESQLRRIQLTCPRPPEGWVRVSLDRVFFMRRGLFSVRPRNDPRYFGGPYPFVQIGDLPRDSGTIRSCQQTLNQKGLLVSKMFPRGSVLVAIAGDTIANTGILSSDSCCPDSLVGLHSENGPLLRFAEAYLTSTKLSCDAHLMPLGANRTLTWPCCSNVHCRCRLKLNKAESLWSFGVFCPPSMLFWRRFLAELLPPNACASPS